MSRTPSSGRSANNGASAAANRSSFSSLRVPQDIASSAPAANSSFASLGGLPPGGFRPRSQTPGDIAPGDPGEPEVPVLDAAHAALGPSPGSQTALQQLLLLDRETTFAAHLAEGLSTLTAEEDFLTVAEVAGTTLRYAGYNKQ